MERAVPPLSRRRIRISASRWTAISTTVFEDVFPLMRRRHAGTLYLVLYHRAWHNKGKVIGASLKDLSEWTGLDIRTVNKCLKYLEWRRFIIRIEHGTLHSSSDLPIWEVPAARFDMKSEGWVPVPSFILTEYLKAHHACLLLPLLLYYQNMRKQNECYPSVATLHRMLGCWSKRMVYESLQLLSEPDRWRRLGIKLLLPIEIVYRRTGTSRSWRRFYRVAAIYYHRERKGSLPVLFLTKNFSQALGIPGASAEDVFSG